MIVQKTHNKNQEKNRQAVLPRMVQLFRWYCPDQPDIQTGTCPDRLPKPDQKYRLTNITGVHYTTNQHPVNVYEGGGEP